MMTFKSSASIVAVAVATTACATVPTGPSVMVLPGTGKSFEQFQADDAICRQWSARQTGTTPAKATTQSTVSGAAIGTAVGAAAGAALGAAAGSPAVGAAAGAGGGLLAGTAIGADRASVAGGSVQRRYDVAYMQCMYAKGNQIPVARSSQPAYSGPPAPAAHPSQTPPGVPPPPAGTPPSAPPASSAPSPPPVGTPPAPPSGPSR